MTAREKAIRSHRMLLNGGKLSYFEERGIFTGTLRTAWVGYDATSGALPTPASPGAVAFLASTTRAPHATGRASAGSGGGITPTTCRGKDTAGSRTIRPR
jgi:hypothetical protein